MHVSNVRDDLLAEQRQLDQLVAALEPSAWSTPTASPRWTVADQIAHLAYFDRVAARAIEDPDGFPAVAERHFAATRGGSADGADNYSLGAYRAMDAAELLAAWRADRAHLEAASATLADDARVPWYGPSMGAKSFLTARLMEAWAHGQDIVDALGLHRQPTDRLGHIVRLGVLTRGWSYVNRGREAPDVDVRIALTAPSGVVWEFGPEGADESVVGSAVDFGLVVTQRRNVDATALVVQGDAAREWMALAQAFAGGPTNGPSA